MGKRNKVNVDWLEREKGKGGKPDRILLQHPNIGDVEIPALKFHDVALEGTDLLRSHGYGMPINENVVSLVVKKGIGVYDGLYGVDVLLYNHWINTVHCDRITKCGDVYILYHKGDQISSFYTKSIERQDI